MSKASHPVFNSARPAPSQAWHRRDIDGLRAIAILPVLLYHAGFRYCPGGFIGVDIFFVISGYLITHNIWTEMEAGQFSIVAFYERRIRRIFPALLVLLAGVSILAYVFLFPAELVDYAKSLIAAAFSCSNFYFWATTDYFNSGQKALLHTWSLAIEEQFYLLFPPFLLLLRRFFPRRVRSWIVATAIASFVLSAITIRPWPSATFFLLPQRAWELLAGSLLATGILRCPANRALREILALIGLTLIAFSVVRFSVLTPFPGPWALLPCGGAAMLILAGGAGPTIAGRVLSLPPFVGIGLISYSLYLWHLPIVVFTSDSTRLVFGRVFSRIFPFLSYPQAVTMERIAFIVLLSMIAAVLSWRFVEQPVRHGRLRPSRRTLFRGSVIAVGATLAIGFAFLALHGLPSRFSPTALRILAQSENTAHYRTGTCFVEEVSHFNARTCLKVEPGRPNWLLMGDSHAAHLYPGLVAVYSKIDFLQMTIAGCKPVPVFRYGESPDCFRQVETIYDDWLPHHRISGVILSANWQSYDLPRLDEAIRRLKGMQCPVVLVGPIFHYDMSLSRMLAVAQGAGADDLVERHRIHSYDDLDRAMAEMARATWQIPYFSFRETFCTAVTCIHWSSPLVPMQWDDTHLTDDGSERVAEEMHTQGFLDRISPPSAGNPPSRS